MTDTGGTPIKRGGGKKVRAVLNRAAPKAARVESCCPAKKCRLPQGHDGGAHERSPLGLAVGR